jgi:16S rRNA (adenine1518-N6/adenine1519-N6)-dimethyltransferase
MTLTEMRDLLTKRDIQLTRSLGQNFLHDSNQLRRIVDAAELKPTDKVLEIGPGLGPLTELLLGRAAAVLAIELDARLIEFLQERFPVNAEGRVIPAPDQKPETAAAVPAQLELVHDDALKFLKREPRDWSDWKLVANLPYSVASPILVELAAGARAPQLMAQADDDDYGVLTLLVQLDFKPRVWFKISASCFFPVPDVDSACVVLERRTPPLLPEDQRASFVKIVKRAFSQRRKMMLKLLKQDWPKEQLEAVFAELKISPQERAEKLSLEQFVELTGRLTAEK